MPDGALPITERAIEWFTEQYLSSLGVETTHNDNRWEISLPPEADTALEVDGATLLFESDPSQAQDGEIPVHPESEFVQRMLAEAKETQVIGSTAFTTENTELVLPAWITAGDLSVESADFAPYYDRVALCVLFDIGIETVSEFQRELLLPIAVDLRTDEILSGLSETYLEATALDNSHLPSEKVDCDVVSIDSAMTTAHEAIEEEINPILTETQEEASRAADVELNDYRQLQDQRLDELADEISTLDDQGSRLSQTIEETTDQEERIEALRERKWVRHKRDEFEEERAELAETRNSGFPEKRREVYDRHSINVAIEPATVTLVSFEKGEMDIVIQEGEHSQALRLPYGTGVGVTEELGCERCGEPLSDDNPGSLSNRGLIGESCCE